MRRDRWCPLATHSVSRPSAGDLIARDHMVWRVEEVTDLSLDGGARDGEDRDRWMDAGMPDLDTWMGRPYRLEVEWVGGARPEWLTDDCRGGTIGVPAGRRSAWQVYPGGRWPQCSCCGEPVPCRAELEDDEVTASLNRVARLEAIPVGHCWACREHITRRQKSVTYLGDNLDLPGSIPQRFHTRGLCRPSAMKYEGRWLAVDPRRERILTWPRCDGILVVHADGASECVGGVSPMGAPTESQPDCRGHDTHDHFTMRACYVGEDYFGPLRGERRCARGCSSLDHPCGARPKSRPERRVVVDGALPFGGAS